MAAELEIKITEEGASDQPQFAAEPAPPATSAPRQPALFPQAQATMIAPNPYQEIQNAATRKLEAIAARKAIELEMRQQSPEYAQEQSAKEEKRAKPAKETTIEDDSPAAQAARKLEALANRHAVEMEMRARSPEYAQQQISREERQQAAQEARMKREAAAQMTVEERAAMNARHAIERETLKKATEQAKRELDQEYAAHAELMEAQKERYAAIRELTEESRRERIALSKMSDEERVEYLARKEAARREEAERVKERALEMRGGAPAKEEFDPYASAKKSREGEIRGEQISAAYEEMYGKTKTAGDAILDMAMKMRGSLGGMFGGLVGVTLDLVAASRNAMAGKSSARQEAERRNAEIREQSQSSPAQQVPDVTQVQRPIERQQQPATPRQQQTQQPATPRQPDEWSGLPTSRRPSGQFPASQNIPTALHAPPGAGNSAPHALPAPRTASPASAGAGAGAVEGSAGAAGAIEGLAEVAGPIGEMVVAAIAATKAVHEFAKGAVRGAADVAVSMATIKDGAERIDGVGQSITSMGDKILLVSPALGMFLGTLGEATSGVARLDAAVKSTAERFGQYHGGLAAQNAMQEVQEMMRDIDRANRFGNRTQEANQARFNMEQRLANITDRFIPFVMAAAERIFTILERGFGAVDSTLVFHLRGLDGMLAALQQIVGAIGLGGGTIQDIRNLLRDMLGTSNATLTDQIWNNFLMGARNVEGIVTVNPSPLQPRGAIRRP